MDFELMGQGAHTGQRPCHASRLISELLNTDFLELDEFGAACLEHQILSALPRREHVLQMPRRLNHRHERAPCDLLVNLASTGVVQVCCHRDERLHIRRIRDDTLRRMQTTMSRHQG